MYAMALLAMLAAYARLKRSDVPLLPCARVHLALALFTVRCYCADGTGTGVAVGVRVSGRTSPFNVLPVWECPEVRWWIGDLFLGDARLAEE